MAEVLDEAFAQAGMPPVADHPFFRPGDHFTYEFAPESGRHLSFVMDVGSDVITIWADRVNEIEWVLKDHPDSRERVVRSLTDFLTSFVLVEHATSDTTKLRFFDVQGALLDKWSQSSNLHSSRKPLRLYYPPATATEAALEARLDALVERWVSNRPSPPLPKPTWREELSGNSGCVGVLAVMLALALLGLITAIRWVLAWAV